MSDDKAENFEFGQTKSTDDMTWDELVTVFGRPMAEEIIKSRQIKHGENKVFVVKEVDYKNGIITVGENE